MPDLSIAEKLRRWTDLVSGLEPDLAALPQLSAVHAELRAAVAEIERLNVEEEFHTARLREITARRNAAERRGNDANGRVVAGLRSAFGKQDEALLKYGVKPLPRRHRAPAARK